MSKIDEDRRYIHKTLNDMKIDDEDKFLSAVSNVIFEQNKKLKQYETQILAMNQKSIPHHTLYDFLIASVDENQKPIWTEEHIEEMLDNFVVRWK
ncbi:MAG: hypothetical protein HFJ47_01695 [Clostridia bacterium]|nr:hypothetical protein [Clostridia bacterium]